MPVEDLPGFSILDSDRLVVAAAGLARRGIENEVATRLRGSAAFCEGRRTHSHTPESRRDDSESQIVVCAQVPPICASDHPLLPCFRPPNDPFRQSKPRQALHLRRHALERPFSAPQRAHYATSLQKRRNSQFTHFPRCGVLSGICSVSMISLMSASTACTLSFCERDNITFSARRSGIR